MDLNDVFYISEINWYKLQAWAKLAHDEDKNEISGLMTAIPQKDGRVEIKDVEILKQENTGTNTELDGDAVSVYMMKYGMKYNNPDMKFVWWHSHHTMAAFWSGTDTNEIEAWKNNSFSLALVINLKEEYLFRVSFWKTNGLPIEYHEDTTLTIERKEPKVNITETMKKKYEDLCSNPIVNTYSGWGNHKNSYNIANRNPNQAHLWQRQDYKNEADLDIERAYEQALVQAESMQDSYVSGTIGFKEWKSEVKKINKILEERKYPFKLINWNLDKLSLLNLLMTKMPNELFEWDDNQIKDRMETIAWNNSFGGYDVY